MILPGLVEELGLEIIADTELILADKRSAKTSVSLAYSKPMDGEGVFRVATMNMPEPILGAAVSEGLGIKIDPATEELGFSRPQGSPTMQHRSFLKLPISVNNSLP